MEDCSLTKHQRFPSECKLSCCWIEKKTVPDAFLSFNGSLCISLHPVPPQRNCKLWITVGSYPNFGWSFSICPETQSYLNRCIIWAGLQRLLINPHLPIPVFWINRFLFLKVKSQQVDLLQTILVSFWCNLKHCISFHHHQQLQKIRLELWRKASTLN